MIRDRASAGKLQKRKLGRPVHGRVPYGYRSTDGILDPVEDLIPVVRRIYRDARERLDAGPDRPRAEPRRRPPSPGRGVEAPGRALDPHQPCLRRRTLRGPKRPRGDRLPSPLQ